MPNYSTAVYILNERKQGVENVISGPVNSGIINRDPLARTLSSWKNMQFSINMEVNQERKGRATISFLFPSVLQMLDN